MFYPNYKKELITAYYLAYYLDFLRQNHIIAFISPTWQDDILTLEVRTTVATANLGHLKTKFSQMFKSTSIKETDKCISCDLSFATHGFEINQSKINLINQAATVIDNS